MAKISWRVYSMQQLGEWCDGDAVKCGKRQASNNNNTNTNKSNNIICSGSICGKDCIKEDEKEFSFQQNDKVMIIRNDLSYAFVELTKEFFVFIEEFLGICGLPEIL
ncbi:Hypothetical predicted protein [Octopus vulgaris]|uniref:Uncharacterized protein n=1 Tax=Octopus vulgaris TaxID=6645 RepID=A0AA36B1P5_OCTVU|nr:Hypothetical predicted protein [Octopus vulgaris]